MNKKLFKNNQGDFHLGLLPPSEDFNDAEKNETEEALKNLSNKKLWRCIVCNDLHLGEIPPKQCPTCAAVDAYTEINEKEFLTILNV